MKYSKSQRIYLIIIIALIALAIFQWIKMFSTSIPDTIDYEFNQINLPSIKPTFPPTATPTPNLKTLMYVSGEVHPNGLVKLYPIFQSTQIVSREADYVSSDSSLPFSLEAVATDESLISKSYFGQQNVEVPKVGSIIGFDQFLPLTKTLGKVIIKKGETIVFTAIPSKHAPELVINSIVIYPHKSLQIHWSGSDLDRDTLYYEVQYSINNGLIWNTKASNITDTSVDLTIPNNLQPSQEAKIKILVSDGINTTATESASFVLEE